jgi:hypothetical protein
MARWKILWQDYYTVCVQVWQMCSLSIFVVSGGARSSVAGVQCPLAISLVDYDAVFITKWDLPHTTGKNPVEWSSIIPELRLFPHAELWRHIMTSIAAFSAIKCNSKTLFNNIKSNLFILFFVYFTFICDWCSLFAICQSAFLNEFKACECTQLVFITSQLVVSIFPLDYECSIKPGKCEGGRVPAFWKHTRFS